MIIIIELQSIIVGALLFCVVTCLLLPHLQGDSEGQGQDTTEEAKRQAQEVAQKPVETVKELFQGDPEREHESSEQGIGGGGVVQQRRGQHGQGQVGGLLQAIGETIFEIAQTTKDIVIGQDQTGGHGDDQQK